jgi:uncharacterized protein (DUF2336 family)
MHQAAQNVEQNQVAERISALMQLARQAEPEARGALYNSVANLVIARGAQLTPEEQNLSRQVLGILAGQVETEIRRALALRLAGRPDAPHDLVLMLANDTIRVAEPVLIHSPVLSDADLVLIIRSASSAHQNIVARRPHIGPSVSEALLEHANDNALGTLLQNFTAQIPAEALRTLVNRASFNPALQAPLALRRDLPQDVIGPLYKMVSAALKAHIQSRYALPAHVLEEDLTRALDDAQRTKPRPAETRAQLLVDKLQRANTLGPNFLLKALLEGQKELFVHGFARLLEISPARMHQILTAADFRPLALCTRALNIDRSVFLTIFNALRADRKTDFDNNEKTALDEIFARTSPQAARARLARIGIGQARA